MDVKFPLAVITIGISLFTTFSTKTVLTILSNFGFGFFLLSIKYLAIKTAPTSIITPNAIDSIFSHGDGYICSTLETKLD